MTAVTVQNGIIVVRDGKVGTEQECCCVCERCMVGGEWDCRYTTQEACEQCVTTHICQNTETAAERTVSSCSECNEETEWCYSLTDGPCGEWNPNAACEPCPCEEHADCPSGQYCCDGVCREILCPDFKYYHIVFHIAGTPGPAGLSKICVSNVDAILLNPCGEQGISRAVSYGPFSGCGLAVTADIGANCALQNIVVLQDDEGDCNDPATRPEFVEIVEISADDCETVFIPD